MKAPRLSKNSAGDYDLLIENGKTPWAEDGTQVAQHVNERLLIFKGEQSLDGQLTTKTESGTKWYEIIFDVSKTKAEKQFEIRRRIMGTPGVEKILELSWVVAGHTLTIAGEIQTAWGAAEIGGEVTPL